MPSKGKRCPAPTFRVACAAGMMPGHEQASFDHSVELSDDTKDASAPARLRRIEVITGVERRRKWSAAAKAEIVAESLVEGAIVSEVARRHGLSPQQLFGWRVRMRAAVNGSAPPCDATRPFVPAIVENEPPCPASP